MAFHPLVSHSQDINYDDAIFDSPTFKPIKGRENHLNQTNFAQVSQCSLGKQPKSQEYKSLDNPNKSFDLHKSKTGTLQTKDHTFDQELTHLKPITKPTTPNHQRKPDTNPVAQKTSSPTRQQYQIDKNYKSSPMTKPLERNKTSNSVQQLSYTLRKPQVILNIDIGGGKVSQLALFEGDDALAVAKEFCQRNNLLPVVVDPLKRQLEIQLEIYNKLKAERNRKRELSRSRQEEAMKITPEFYPTNSVRDIPNNARLNTQPASPPQKNALRKETSEANLQKETIKRPVERSPPEKSKLKERSNSVKSLKNRGSLKSPSTGDTDSYEMKGGRHQDAQENKHEIFNRLYQDAMAKEYRQNQLKQSYLSEKQEQEINESTFHPKINQNSVHLAEKRREFLDQKWKESESRIAQRQGSSPNLSQMRLENILQHIHCESQQVSKRSRNKGDFERSLFNNTMDSVQRSTELSTVSSKTHSRLYEDGRKRDLKRAQAEEIARKEHSFTPEINNKSRELSRKNQQAIDSDNTVHEQLYRMSQWRERSSSPYRVEDEIDLKTGQRLYQPSINKQNRYYEIAERKEPKAFVEEVVEVDEDEYNKIITPTAKKTLKASIMRQTKGANTKTSNQSAAGDKVLRAVFDSLDSDKDGFISKDAVDMSKLGAEVLEAISEIIGALEEQSAVYDFAHFKKLILKFGLLNRLAILLGMEVEDASPPVYNNFPHKSYII